MPQLQNATMLYLVCVVPIFILTIHTFEVLRYISEEQQEFIIVELVR
jgi:hypothetical protein